MPRPGPRPYECVRRAWHSDRHQPMRGSIIQQIFRVVNDSHSLATKKNREWQEKLPMVVIRAEEIMYSKANSEAEYMNLETLWERVNDAINTIIRREESTETGDLLPPCVEAALNLGCVPVRASRSQRHNNPRTYLTPRVQEPVPETSRISDRLTSEQFLHSPAVHSPHAPKVARSENACSVLPVTESSNPVIERHERAAPSSHPLQYENGSQRFNQLMALETKPSTNLGSVYPLYYGNHHHTEELQEGSRVPKNPGAILVGTPVGPSVPEHTETIMWPNFLSRKSSDGSSNTTRRDDGRSTAEKSQEKDCDLSLRLSLSSDPCGSMRRTQVPYAEDFDSRCLQGDTVFTASHQHVDKKFCFLQSTTLNTEQLQFLPSRTSNMEQLQFTPYNWISGDKDRILEASLRKRKEPFRNNEGAGQSGWLPEYRHNWDTGSLSP